jgi:hypothetical protein
MRFNKLIELRIINSFLDTIQKLFLILRKICKLNDVLKKSLLVLSDIFLIFLFDSANRGINFGKKLIDDCIGQVSLLQFLRAF